MTVLERMLKDTKFVTILDHIRPGGDCLGSALGFCSHFRLNRPDIWTAVYLEESSPKSNYLKRYDKIHHQADDMCHELCVCLDSGDIQRLGDFKRYLNRADKSLRLDHHVTNTRYGGTNVVPDEASSTCEVLFDQLDGEKIDRHTAGCLYTDIVHGTGVFKLSCISTCTMEIAGELMEKGVDFGAIVDNNSYRETYIQNRILGRALLESITFFDERCIFSTIRQNEVEFYGVDGKDLNGIIDQLRLTEDVKVAIFIYETGTQEFKVSMRPRYLVDIGRITAFFGSGGHIRTVGYTISGSIHDVVSSLSVHIARQLDAVPNGQK